MKIGYFSDLHTELFFDKKDLHSDFARTLADAYSSADVVVAAGDIGAREHAIEFLQNAFPKKPVIYVPGNHDHWAGEVYATLRKMKDAAAGSNVHLHFDGGGTIEIDGVLFCGATLWTNYGLRGVAEANFKRAPGVMSDYGNIQYQEQRVYQPHEVMLEAQNTMNDYRKIRVRKNGAKIYDAPRDALGNLKKEVPRRLNPQDLLAFHKVALANIQAAMAAAANAGKKLVVVTHHAPSVLSLLYKGETIEKHFYVPSDPFYASHLDYLMHGEDAPVLWVHGHTHIATAYEVGNTVVVSNPKGYGYGDDTGFEMGKIAEI